MFFTLWKSKTHPPPNKKKVPSTIERDFKPLGMFLMGWTSAHTRNVLKESKPQRTARRDDMRSRAEKYVRTHNTQVNREKAVFGRLALLPLQSRCDRLPRRFIIFIAAVYIAALSPS
ncbi:hypothetical protein OUZ56_000325 [Daphnia magna]|uniref:Uncharacterized protein n=1 Tax=Daphnia magna TaxID=35525 RepID=A0ABQ9ZZH6_9CRUS|nr:hypothetical protein OUZ56_000325 [Daphnia magna]